MALMLSPEGEEREIVSDGVAALRSLGWELSEPDADAEVIEEPAPAPATKTRTTRAKK